MYQISFGNIKHLLTPRNQNQKTRNLFYLQVRESPVPSTYRLPPLHQTDAFSNILRAASTQTCISSINSLNSCLINYVLQSIINYLADHLMLSLTEHWITEMLKQIIRIQFGVTQWNTSRTQHKSIWTILNYMATAFGQSLSIASPCNPWQVTTWNPEFLGHWAGFEKTLGSARQGNSEAIKAGNPDFQGHGARQV